MDLAETSLYINNSRPISSIARPGYWSKYSITTGSAYFARNTKKLTKQSFDELIQEIDKTIIDVNTTDLLKLDTVKLAQQKVLRDDLSNIKTILPNPMIRTQSASLARQLEALTSENVEQLKGIVSKKKVGEQQIIRGNKVRITPSSSSVMFSNYTKPAVPISNAASASASFLDSSLIGIVRYVRLDNEFSYFYLMLSGSSNLPKNMAIILQSEGVTLGSVTLSVDINIGQVVSAIGEVQFSDQAIATVNSPIGAQITHNKLTLQTCYSHANYIYHHTHPNIYVRVPRSTDIRDSQQEVANIANAQFVRYITYAGVHISSIVAYAQGVVRR